MPVDSHGLKYLDTGNSKGRDLPVIVFLHAFPLDHRMWRQQVAALRDSYRVLAPDFRGLGANARDPHLLIDFFVDDLLRLQDELGIRSAAYCGLSMGGYVALRALEREPERCRALILCDTRAEGDANQAKLKRADSIRLIQRSGVDAFLDGFLRTAMWSGTFEKNPELVNRVLELARDGHPDSVIAALIALAARTDLSHVLPSIRISTLIMVGAFDMLTPPREAEQMKARIPGAELRILENAGHYSNLENPGHFNLELKGFLDKTLI